MEILELDAKNRDAKNRDAKNRDAKNRDAKNRDAKNRSRKRERKRERERERDGSHAVQLPQGRRTLDRCCPPGGGGVVIPFSFEGRRLRRSNLRILRALSDHFWAYFKNRPSQKLGVGDCC